MLQYKITVSLTPAPIVLNLKTILLNHFEKRRKGGKDEKKKEAISFLK